MKRFASKLSVCLVFAAAVLFSGCPLLGMGSGGLGLDVAPVAVNFGSDATVKTISLTNTTLSPMAWTISESIPWLTVSPTSGTTATNISQITLTVDRGVLPPGNFTGDLFVTSTAGVTTVKVAMQVAGSPTLGVSPLAINLINQQEVAELTITNGGTGPLQWSLSLRDPDDPSIPVATPDFLTIAPLGAVTQPGLSTKSTITIDRDLVPSGVTSFILLVTSAAGNQQVELNITQGLSAEIGVEPSVLDFGETQSTLTFDVFNSGEAGSTLDFTLSTDRTDLIFFSPASGTSTGVSDPDNYDRVPIAVTIDRGALTGLSDGGTITVSAPGLDPVEVVVSVTSSGLVFEGAQNRTRPPFILRFVFLLRDALGNAINTLDPDILEEIADGLSIEENEQPIDLDETNFFVTSAENLRYNVVVLLDYTGSMFAAGAGNGSAIAQQQAAAVDFVNDLPATYRIALMEYHERQQSSRIIHNFATSKSSLTSALQAFSLPSAEHGASEIYDALMDAVKRLVDEDVGSLSFDDADVRAVVFVSDGRDTSSITSLAELIDEAKKSRVRLYPIGFGNQVRPNDLIQMAVETGGHYYPAPTVTDLVNLLQNEIALGGGAPGVITKELQRQLVLTYISLLQGGEEANYLISGDFRGLTGSFQESAVIAIGGDVRAGQIGLTTAGIQPDGTAEVFVRTEYVPRNISQFRFRFISTVPIVVEKAPGDLVSEWILVDEGGGVFTVLAADPLPVGAFGNLIRVRYSGLNPADTITLGFRTDNRIYINAPLSKFFQHPEEIEFTSGSTQVNVVPVSLGDVDPDDPKFVDRDEDTVADFNDLNPDNPALP
ncbi:MAG: hypothetical protein AMXMBFR84_48940 [Candidatus Hydrogenedentota bacterium]